MPTYATQADFEAYVEGYVTDDAAALGRLLEKAERDIDRLLFHGIGVPTNGLRIVPANLTTWAREGLARAVCAQAEYRLAKGEPFFVEKQLPGRSGGDFSSPVAEPRYGPKVFEELRQSGLIRHAVRML